MCLRNVPDVIIGTIASHTNEQKKGEQQHLTPHGADRSGGYPPRQFIAFGFRVACFRLRQGFVGQADFGSWLFPCRRRLRWGHTLNRC
jgi:hypothetical protein